MKLVKPLMSFAKMLKYRLYAPIKQEFLTLSLFVACKQSVSKKKATYTLTSDILLKTVWHYEFIENIDFIILIKALCGNDCSQ